MIPWLNLSIYLVIGLTLVIGVMLGILTTFIIRFKSTNFGSIIPIISNIAQSLSVVIALLALVVTLGIAQDQFNQTRKQYTRDFIDKAKSGETKQALDAIADAAMSAASYILIKSQFKEIARGYDESKLNRTFYLPDGTPADDAAYEKFIISLLKKSIRGQTFIIEFLREISSCKSSNVCDSALSDAAACEVLASASFLDDELAENKQLFKIVQATSPTDIRDSAAAMSVNMGFIPKSFQFDCRTTMPMRQRLRIDE